MLSLNKGFLFLHIPKTGGNSIQDALREYSDDQFVRLGPHQDGVERFELRSSKYDTNKHSTLAEYRRYYGDALFSQLFKFCCVRNPWDRCISYYYSPHWGRVKWNRDQFKSFVKNDVMPVIDYLAFNPAEKESFDKCIENINFVMRYENLQADFDFVCKHLNLPQTTLPFRNVSTKGDYKSYYDKELEEVVRERFLDEITYFGYSL